MSDFTKGLRASIFRDAYFTMDNTNGGFSRDVDQVTVVGVMHRDSHSYYTVSELPKHLQAFEAFPDAPAVMLVIWGAPDELVSASGKLVNMYVISVDLVAKQNRTNVQPDGSFALYRTGMFGGNFAGNGDSRWSELTHGVELVKIHDRFER